MGRKPRVDRTPEVVAAIQQFLSGTLDSSSRIAVLNALGDPSVQDGHLISMVIASMDDSDQGVRSTAIQALTRMGPRALRQAEPALQRLADDRNQPTEISEAAREALKVIRSPKK